MVPQQLSLSLVGTDLLLSVKSVSYLGVCLKCCCCHSISNIPCFSNISYAVTFKAPNTRIHRSHADSLLT